MLPFYFIIIRFNSRLLNEYTTIHLTTAFVWLSWGHLVFETVKGNKKRQWGGGNMPYWDKHCPCHFGRYMNFSDVLIISTL